MKKLLFSATALSVCFLNGASAADDSKGATVTISGCVATDKDRSFVLTDVQEVSAPPSSVPNPTLQAMGIDGTNPNVVYWLSKDSVKRMRNFANQKVEVTGVVTEVSAGKMRIKQDPGKPGPDNDNKVEIKADGKKATYETDKSVTGDPSPVKSDETKAMTVREVKVDTVKMLAATCK